MSVSSITRRRYAILVLESPVMIDFDGNLADYGAALNFNAYIIIQVLQLTTSG